PRRGADVERPSHVSDASGGGSCGGCIAEPERSDGIRTSRRISESTFLGALGSDRNRALRGKRWTRLERPRREVEAPQAFRPASLAALSDRVVAPSGKARPGARCRGARPLAPARLPG